MAKPDDLAAVRTLVETLKPFEASEQERIIRWAREKLGLNISTEPPTRPRDLEPSVAAPAALQAGVPARPLARDLRTFVTEKDPKTDAQFAATVAYYYQFEAPPERKKAAITADDLLEACRLADRERLKHPGQTLRNALQSGLFDRLDQGSFALNSVGENLVAMTLPGGPERASSRKSPERKQKAKRGT